MKILFSCIAAISHFKPMLPFANALKARGHDVRFATSVELSEDISKAGFQLLTLDRPSEQASDQVKQQFANIPAKDLGKIYAAQVFLDIFPKTALPKLLKDLASWRPDLIVREPTEFSSLIAAQKLGIRHVRIEIVNGESEESLATNYHKQIDKLRSDVGLPPAGIGYLKDEPAFSAHPQALDDTPRINSQSPIRFLADPLKRSNAGIKPDWLPKDDLPLIYATFGTIAAGLEHCNDIYRIALEAFSELPVNVLLTTGKDAPADLISSVPPNVIVRSFVPQADVLPHAQLMVSHGGSGTVIAGLAFGVPMVITPMFADQPDNARCLQSVGLSISISAADVASLKNAVITALADDNMRERAQLAAKEVEEMATVDEAVDLMLSA